MNLDFGFKYLYEEIFKLLKNNHIFILSIISCPFIIKFIFNNLTTFYLQHNEYEENEYEENEYEENEYEIDDDKFNYGFFRK